MKKLCGECAKRTVEARAVTGRSAPFRNFPALAIPASIAIPTCTSCGAEWIDGQTARKLDAALSEQGSQVLARLGREAIEVLSADASQRELEAVLGLSAGYLSKVRHGKETPSAPLVALLALLATRPGRLNEVARAWSSGKLPPRVVSDNFSRVQLDVDPAAPVAC